MRGDGFVARAGRRRDRASASDEPTARQEVQARHRGRRRPPGASSGDLRQRLAESVETALAPRRRRWSSRRRTSPERGRTSEQLCAAREHCGVSLAELAPRTLLASTRPTARARPARARHASRSTRPGRPRPRRSRSAGRARAWHDRRVDCLRAGARGASPNAGKSPLDRPWKKLPRERRTLLLTARRRARVRDVTGAAGASAVRDVLRGRHREPRAALPRDRVRAASGALSRVHALRPARRAAGARLRPRRSP